MSVSLSALVRALERLAPPALAEEWDNVGLLVDPRAPGQELELERVLLTIDFTEAVLAEALRERASALIAYHPPLFQPLRRLSRRRAPALYGALAAGLAVYSPHTALDAAADGLNDWLVAGLGAGSVAPLQPAQQLDAYAELKLVVFVPESHLVSVREALSESGAGVIGAYRECSFALEGEGTFFGDESTNPALGERGRLERVREARLEMVCSRAALPRAAAALARVHPYEEPAWDVVPLAAKPQVKAGLGRCLTLSEATPLSALVERVKQHLGLSRVRLATAAEHAAGKLISKVAVCAGAGGSVLGAGVDAELLVSGEMRHHDVLARLAEGKSVILCDHTNSERGYLPRYRERILAACDGAVEVLLASSDREPLAIV